MSLILSLIASTLAFAGACNHDGVCVGDHTFAFYREAAHAGVVQGVRDASILFLTDGEKKAASFEPKRVAVSKTGACLAGVADLCVGYVTERKDGNGKAVAGKVVGYFTSGFVVVDEAGAISSVGHESFESISNGAPVPANPAPPPAAVDPNSLSDLVAQAKKGTLHLADYLKLWNPADDHATGPNPFTRCLDADQSNHPARQTADGYLAAYCAPDTLYSWGPLEKLHDLEAAIGAGAWKKRPFFNDALYLAESPASSFGYGSEDESGGYAFRAKLRAGVRFKFVDEAPDCPNFEEAEAANTVYVRIFTNDHGDGKFSSGQDFVLCSSSPLESWSYGTKQFYDELVNDVIRIRDPARKNDHISYMTRPDAKGHFQPANFDLGSDSHPFSLTQLANTLKLQLLMSADTGGKVYFNPKLRADPAVTGAAFKTRMPSWFNGNAAP